MPHNYRNQSNRPESRGGGYQGGSDRDAHRGSEYSSNSDRNGQWRNTEGQRDRYLGRSGYRGDSGRDYNRDVDRDFRPSADRDQNFGDRDERGSRMRDWGHFDESDRWSSQGSGGQDYRFGGGADFYERDRGTSAGKWHEDQGDGGGYFNTGSYIDDGASRSLSQDFYRAIEQQRSGSRGFRDRDNTGDRSYYGSSYYGSQSNYGRGQADDSQNQPWPSQRSSGNYEDRSSWNYGQGAGSGSSGGAYGRDPQLSGRNSGSSAGSGSAESFRGRGPRGYQRSDDRLKEMICERLTDDPAIDASNITIEVNGQVVKLTGTVDDRSTKYEIEELIEHLGGVKDIDNQLKVQSSRWGSQQQADASSGQQPRGGSDSEAGSSGTTSSANTTGRSSSSTGSSAGATGSSSAGSSSKRN